MFASSAECRLSGEVDLSYTNYNLRNNSNQNLSASGFTQNYSLLYDTKGRFYDGRLGKYNVLLGYEWAALNSSITATSGSTDINKNRGHIIYRGEVLIDPKEFPIRLTAYSRDITRQSFSTDSNPLFTNSYNNFYSAISPLNTGSGAASSLSNTIIPTMSAPGIPTNILNGIHIESGATLTMGVKNGMTNGYSELLRHFPMLLLDYRDTVEKDYNRDYPIDQRLIKLAFVSLNKKDNWFHYRYSEFKDYISSSNNYYETQLQLGTVDHTNARQWIDFSNWLAVSADGQLTKKTQAYLGINQYEEFSFNLYGAARRSTWEARIFNNFTRRKEDFDRITYKSSVPLYANGIISPTANWSAYTTYADNSSNKGDRFTDITVGYRINTFTKSPFTFSHSLGFEHAEASNKLAQLADNTIDVISGSIETTSTPMYSRAVTLGANYTIRASNNSNLVNTTFIDQMLTENVTYNLSNNLRLALNQTNRLTSGESGVFVGNDASTGIRSPQYYNPRDNSVSNGAGFQSITQFSAFWNPKPRLNITASISEDLYFPSNAPSSNVIRAEGIINYTLSDLTFTSKNSYATGTSYAAAYTANKSSQYNINSENVVRYTPNRNFDATAGLSYTRELDSSISTLNAEEKFNYYYYTTNGLTRKLFEINQGAASLEEATARSTTSYSLSRTNTFLLGTKYYPMRQLMIAGGARYAYIASQPSNAYFSYYGSMALQYRLFEASIDYTYGKNRIDGRIEKRFFANLKKRF